MNITKKGFKIGIIIYDYYLWKQVLLDFANINLRESFFRPFFPASLITFFNYGFQDHKLPERFSLSFSELDYKFGYFYIMDLLIFSYEVI
ncbi:hypothetical protein BGV40_13515 [Methanosarcina sp. Ant1]|nr:hypothetical protein BGV40_13515 [Methanosarcina sp. Ant1]